MQVLVVDAHAIYRRGLVAALEGLIDVEAVHVGTPGGGEAQRNLADVDVAIVDVTSTHGCETIGEVAAAGGARVIACVANEEEEGLADAVRAREAGAIGLLRKDTLTQPLLEAAVRAAADGAGVIAEGLLDVLPPIQHAIVAEPEAGPVSPLTDREQQVLALIAEGHPTREVALRLSYSERTVKNVLHDAATKLNARTRSHAVAHAVRAGLI
jgi:DNA-binding NarL/FixJ family response regulator